MPNSPVLKIWCRLRVLFLSLAVTQAILVHQGLGQVGDPAFSSGKWQKFSGNPLFSTVGEPGSWNGSPTFHVLGHGLGDEMHAKLYLSGYDGEHHSIGLITTTDMVAELWWASWPFCQVGL